MTDHIEAFYNRTRRHGRVATRWLQRYLEARSNATIDEAILVAASLQELGGVSHGVALTALRDMADAACRKRASAL